MAKKRLQKWLAFCLAVSMLMGTTAMAVDGDEQSDEPMPVVNTNLNFSLVVEPGEGDDLVVSVVSSDGSVLAKARLAGDASNDDDSFTGNLVMNGDGNYTFTNLPLIENSNQTFSLNLEGAQYLEEGVYIFRNADGVDASQTYVTYAEGTKSVDLEAKVDFFFNVKEGTVKERKTWEKRDAWGDDDDDTPKGDDDDDDTVIGDDDVPKGEFPGDDDDDIDNIPEEDIPMAELPDEDVPLEELPEEDVPLADVPKTGDASILWFALSALSGAGLMGLNLTGKKREDEE